MYIFTYIYMYMYIYTCIHICTDIFTYMYIYIYINHYLPGEGVPLPQNYLIRVFRDRFRVYRALFRVYRALFRMYRMIMPNEGVFSECTGLILPDKGAALRQSSVCPRVEFVVCTTVCAAVCAAVRLGT